MNDQSPMDAQEGLAVNASPATTVIIAAVAQAMGRVTKVLKADQNKEQGYSFASVDDFLAMVNPICAESGLVPLMQEAGVELVSKKGRNGDQDWLRFHFIITLMHTSGETLGPFFRQVEVMRSGAQAFGMAQSYVLKQFLRGLFLIATGDKDDPDFGEPSNQNRDGAKPDHREEQARKPVEASPEQLAEALGAISGAKSGRDLIGVLRALPGIVAGHPVVIQTRREVLSTLVKGAQTIAALNAMAETFKPDWSVVAEAAELRAAELNAEAADRARAEAAADLQRKRDAAERAATADTHTQDRGDTDPVDEIPY